MTTTVKNLYKVYKANKNVFLNTMRVLHIEGNEENSYLLYLRKSIEKSINNSIANERLSVVTVYDLNGIMNMVNDTVSKILRDRGYEDEIIQALIK